MVSLRRCREIPGGGLDAEVALAREQMYALADVAIRVYAERRASGSNTRAGFGKALKLLPSDEADDATERAAIIEYEAGRSRDEPERQALVAVVTRHRGHA